MSDETKCEVCGRPYWRSLRGETRVPDGHCMRLGSKRCYSLGYERMKAERDTVLAKAKAAQERVAKLEAALRDPDLAEMLRCPTCNGTGMMTIEIDDVGTLDTDRCADCETTPARDRAKAVIAAALAKPDAPGE